MVCVRVHVGKVYGQIATCSASSVFLLGHAHVHERMETTQCYRRRDKLVYVYAYPDPDPDTYEERHGLKFLFADFDECAQNITVCFHACINTEGSYLCSCNVGFEFANDNYTCINIDECARNISNCSFKCNDTNGSFLCLCPDGFKLDSDMVTCVDINECTTTSHGCSDECVNSEGSYRCQCPQGYSLEWQDGRGTCRDDNECEPGGHDCLEEMNEECKNTPGSFECVCTEGYELSTDRGSPTCERISATNSDSDSNSVDTAVTAGIAAFIFVSVGPTCFLLVFLLR